MSIDTDHTCYTMTTAGSEGFLTLIPIYLDHILYPTLTVSSLIYKSFKTKNICFVKVISISNTNEHIRSIGKIKFLTDEPNNLQTLISISVEMCTKSLVIYEHASSHISTNGQKCYWLKKMKLLVSMISRYSVTKQDNIHFPTIPLNGSLASSEVSIINNKVFWIIPEYHFYIILFISIQI